MTGSDTPPLGTRPDDAAARALRLLAEARLRPYAAPPLEAPLAAPSPEALQKILHELRVHQIELEMQNEELRRAKEDLEDRNQELRQTQRDLDAARARWFDLYDVAPVGYGTVSESGLIVQSNLTLSTLLHVPRAAMVNRPFSQFIVDEDQDTWYLVHRRIIADGTPRSCDLRMERVDEPSWWAHLTITAARDAQGAAELRIVVGDITARKQVDTTLRRLTESLEAEIDERGSQLRKLAAELTRSEERERRALAEVLHDNLAQVLAAVKIRLAVVERESLDQSVRSIEALIDTADQLLRTVIYELSPPMLRSLGLGPSLHALAEEVERVYGVAVRVYDDSDPHLLEEAMRTLMYRAARELLINVAKHAGVAHAELSCSVDRDRLVVAVSDDGSGFSPALVGSPTAKTSGFGLLSIRERFIALGGALDIDSVPGAGSTVVLSLPLAASPAAPAAPASPAAERVP